MFGIVPLAKVRGLRGPRWQSRALGVGETSSGPGNPTGVAGARPQLGGPPQPCPPRGSRSTGYAGRDRPSEVWCQRARLSLQPEEKQKAAQQFSKLQTAMKVLGISPDEQKACWLILAAIYHLGAAGATKGNPRRVPTA